MVANTVAGEPRAVKVSFDRPLADSGFGQGFLSWGVNLVRWLERSGYDVTYATNIDTHANGGELLNHQAFFSPAHDEYWSKEMRDAVEAARDGGVNLAFFGANSAYTQVRFEPSTAGVANRVMVCYRWTPDPGGRAAYHDGMAQAAREPSGADLGGRPVHPDAAKRRLRRDQQFTLDLRRDRIHRWR